MKKKINNGTSSVRAIATSNAISVFEFEQNSGRKYTEGEREREREQTPEKTFDGNRIKRKHKPDIKS